MSDRKNPSATSVDRRPLIIHVVYRFDVGGLENGVVNLINNLPAEKWRHVIVALTSVSAQFAQRVNRSDVTMIALGKGPGHLFALYPRLYRLFREHRPAIVHTRNLAALEAMVPAALARIPVRIHGEHGWDVGDLGGVNERYAKVRRWFGRAVNHWIAMSKDIERYLVDRIGVPTHAVTQIYNGVDMARFQASAGGDAEPVGFPFAGSDFWLFGSVGRMEPVKNQIDLARAFVLMRQRDSEAARRTRLMMVGGGSLLEPVREILRAGGALDYAWLAGERSDVPSIVSRMSCFVLPSLAEGISNTILEAMASRVPVIATAVGGNCELVADGVTGRLVPPADPSALADAILGYFHDEPMRVRHAEAGRTGVLQSFTLSRMVTDYDSLYERLLVQRGRMKRGDAGIDRIDDSSRIRSNG